MTTEKPATTAALPALRLDEHGRRRVDTTTIMRLAGPLMLNSALQAVLNLTDTWFVGHLSTAAVAAVGAIYWFVIAAILLPGGVALCVQPFVAQEYGAGRRRRAAQTTWMGVWAALVTTPVFLLFALLGPALLAPFGLPTDLAQLGVDYWIPRMVGGPLAVMLFGLLGFFNGIGRPWLAMIVTALVALVNAILNPVLIFGLDLGVAGSAWATTVAQGVGVLTAVLLLLSSRFRPRYATHQVWRPSWTRLRRHFTLGLPMGLAGTADLVALAVFQLLLVRLGTVEGAATQIAMVLTTLAYLPGVGIALAGTTLVGQAIGAGDRDWAYALGNAVIRIDIAAMGVIGLALALAGPWLVPLFVNAADPSAPAVIELALPLLWIAAAYQFFDGLSIGSNYCLRGATDTRVPAVLVTVLAWCLWVPLTHMLTFAPDTGLVGWLPALGYGALGGWVALVIYVVALGAALFLRWRSGAWRRLAVA